MAPYDASETPSTVLGFAILGTSILTMLFPWWGKSRFVKVALHAPLILLPMYFAYEALMPARMNIRGDIPILWTLIGVSMVCYLIKLVVFQWINSPTEE